MASYIEGSTLSGSTYKKKKSEFTPFEPRKKSGQLNFFILTKNYNLRSNPLIFAETYLSIESILQNLNCGRFGLLQNLSLDTDGNLTMLTEDYFRDRTLPVLVNGLTIEWISICGQCIKDSAISPLLGNIYFNNILQLITHDYTVPFSYSESWKYTQTHKRHTRPHHFLGP